MTIKGIEPPYGGNEGLNINNLNNKKPLLKDISLRKNKNAANSENELQTITPNAAFSAAGSALEECKDALEDFMADFDAANQECKRIITRRQLNEYENIDPNALREYFNENYKPDDEAGGEPVTLVLDKNEYKEMKLPKFIITDEPPGFNPANSIYKGIIESGTDNTTSDGPNTQVPKPLSAARLINLPKEEADALNIRPDASSEGINIINTALEYNGKNANEMRKIMQDAGYAFHSRRWCADFATFILGETCGKDNIPGDFLNTCDNTSACQAIRSWARDNDCWVKNTDELQPGDLVIFGNASHAAIFISKNEDGTINTIEGNTSNNSSRSCVDIKLNSSRVVSGYVALSKLS